jgi:hypothetical protein
MRTKSKQSDLQVTKVYSEIMLERDWVEGVDVDDE